MLASTIAHILDQRVVLERDQAASDRYGARSGQDWQALATVPCKAWWEKQSARGPAREEATTSDTIAMAEGGLLIPGGTDVTTQDRISEITDAAGNVLFTGPFQINAVLPHDSHPALMELSFMEPA